MKKTIALLLAALLLLLAAAATAETVDAYSSASLTKSVVAGEDLEVLAKVLETSGADIATKAQAAAPDYVKEYGKHVQIISVNPDGCPGMSTIGYWRYVNNRADGRDVTITAGDWSFTNTKDDVDQVCIQLTDGQNARNIAAAGVGGRATLMIKLDTGVYLLHLNVTEVFEQKFDQAAYDAGNFASGYSGADRQASSYYFVFDVLNIEKSNQILL